MKLKKLTHYQFSHEHGITGNLVSDPTFYTTKEGKQYAKLTIYCKAIDKMANKNNKKNKHHLSSKSDEIPLIAYINIFDEDLLSAIEKLKKGYFVNFKFDKIIFSLSKNETSDALRINALFVANDFIVRYTPKKAKAEKPKNYQVNYQVSGVQ